MKTQTITIYKGGTAIYTAPTKSKARRYSMWCAAVQKQLRAALALHPTATRAMVGKDHFTTDGLLGPDYGQTKP